MIWVYSARHYSCWHWLLLIWVTISRCAHYVTVSLPDSLMPPHSPQKSYFHRLHTMWLLFFVISEAHLHVHLLSSSPPLPPLHLLGVGLSPTRIACGTFIMIPDCRLALPLLSSSSSLAISSSSSCSSSFFFFSSASSSSFRCWVKSHPDCLCLLFIC